MFFKLEVLKYLVLAITLSAQKSVSAKTSPPDSGQIESPTQRVNVKVSTSIVESANRTPAEISNPRRFASSQSSSSNLSGGGGGASGLRQERYLSTNINNQNIAAPPAIGVTTRFGSSDALFETPPSRQAIESIDWNSVIRAQLNANGRIQEYQVPQSQNYDSSQFYKRSTSSSWQLATPQPLAGSQFPQPPYNHAAHQMAGAQPQHEPLVGAQFYGSQQQHYGNNNNNNRLVQAASEARQPQFDNQQQYSFPFQQTARGNQMQQVPLKVTELQDRSSQLIQQQQRQQQQLQQQPQPEQRCQRRSLARVLRNAKDLLTGGLGVIERSAVSPGSSIGFGSGLLAAAIPVFALLLPEFNMRSLTGGGGAGNNIVARFGLQGRVESMMGWVERSIEHLPNFPRLHPQECVKRSICEAHNEPDKYGAIGFTLRLLFPASNLTSTDRMDDMEYKVINKYRYAAGYGLTHRVDVNNGTGSTTACKDKYEDCLVSLLDVARNLVDVFVR